MDERKQALLAGIALGVIVLLAAFQYVSTQRSFSDQRDPGSRPSAVGTNAAETVNETRDQHQEACAKLVNGYRTGEPRVTFTSGVLQGVSF